MGDLPDGDPGHEATGTDGGGGGHEQLRSEFKSQLQGMEERIGKQIAGSIKRQMAKTRSPEEGGVPSSGLTVDSEGNEVTVEELVERDRVSKAERSRLEATGRKQALVNSLSDKVVPGMVDIVADGLLSRGITANDSERIKTFLDASPQIVPSGIKPGSGAEGGGGYGSVGVQGNSLEKTLSSPEAANEHFDRMAGGVKSM